MDAALPCAQAVSKADPTQMEMSLAEEGDTWLETGVGGLGWKRLPEWEFGIQID